MTPERREEILAKRRKEKGSGPASRPFALPPARKANTHDITEVVNIDDLIEYTANTHLAAASTADTDCEEPSQSDLLAHMAGRSQSGTSPGDIRRVLAAKQGNGTKTKTRKVHETSTVPETVVVGDTTYYLNKGETIVFQGQHYTANTTMIHYWVGRHESSALDKALVDRGANGGICGDDMLVVEGSERFVDVSGLAGHRENQLRIVTAQALIHTHKGDAIATFHQMALLGKGKSILSCVQMEHYGAQIDDKSRRLPGGKQRILMDGYQIPLDFHNGLAYLQCRPPTESELSSLPHIIMTSDVDWDPCIYDNQIVDLDEFFDAQEEEVYDSPFDQFGDYRHRTIALHSVHLEPEFFDAFEHPDCEDILDDLVDHQHPDLLHDVYQVHGATSKPSKRDYEALRPFFGWAPSDTIRRTIEVTTQCARSHVSETLRHH